MMKPTIWELVIGVIVIALGLALVIGVFMILIRITDIIDTRVINKPWFNNFIIGWCIFGIVVAVIIYWFA